MEIIDVTRTVKNGMTIWPGDIEAQINNIQIKENGDKNTYSSISLGVHTGTHIDAPWHFINGGKKVHELNLDRFIGKCKVFYIKTNENIKDEDLEKFNIEQNDIVLFKTINSNISLDEPFQTDFIALDTSASNYLVSKKVKCVGVDYLSVEPFYINNSVHNILLGNEIGIIEGLMLKHVQEGEYFISCLPLKLEEAEGSPVRAVLINGI